MKFYRALPLLFAMLLSLSAASLQATVVAGPDPAHAGYLRVQNQKISREQAAAIVKRRYGGRILAVSETTKNGRSVYRVKGLSDKSQVYVVYVDKQSGRIFR